MAGAGYKLFNTGDVLTAAQVNTYLMQQTVMVFASATARTTALSGVLAEGMVSYLQDTNATEVYDGSAWVAIGNTGDITSVGVTSPITGGGTSGAVTIAIQDATTAQKGAVQLTDSTSSTSTTTAATPNSVKTAYDLANGAIAKTLTTTTGDIIYASSANTPARLGIGTSGQVLTVSGGIPSWATASSGSSFVGCRLYITGANQSISNDTVTVINFDAETYDTSSFHDNTTNNSRVTVPSGKGGYYLIAAKAYWVAASDTQERQLRINKNGTALDFFFDVNVNSNAAHTRELVSIFNLAVGDYIEMAVYQFSGATRTIQKGESYTTLSMQYLGA